MMKKKLGYLGGIFLLMGLVSAAFIRIGGVGRFEAEKSGMEELLVVTSFYPVYLITDNLAAGVPGVRVCNLTDHHAGCIHDYQLTTEDMRLLSEADLFLINGGGMEAFVTQAAALREELVIEETLGGIELLDIVSVHDHSHDSDHRHAGEDDHSEGHVHEEEHDHEEGNAHAWMDPERYALQVKNVLEALCAIDPEHEALYRRNAERYQEEIEQVKEEFAALREETQGLSVIVFHDAFVYLAEALKMEVLFAAALDEDTAVSAGELALMIEEMRRHGGWMIWEEAGVDNPAGERLAKEANGSVYELDPLLSGNPEEALDVYGKVMRDNLAVIKEAIADGGK